MIWTREVQTLRQGGSLIYPTETFYALGCLATNHMAVEQIFAAKGRSLQKTMPLIVSDWGMVEKFLHLSASALDLARAFWPGSLSIITDVDDSISILARDNQGQAAVRMTPHPIAQSLCAQAGTPLISSSANFSGGVPACVPQDLDADLVRASGAMIIDARPWPQGGQPSTLVKVLGSRELKILREGAVSGGELSKRGYVTV